MNHEFQVLVDKFLRIIISLLIMFICILPVSCRRNQQKDDSVDEFLKVKVAPVISGTPEIAVKAIGILSTREELKLSFKTGGIIDRIVFEEGAKVRKGEIMAALDLTEIEANVEIARQGLEKAERDYTRADNLYRDSVGTLERQQNALTALSAAKKTYEIALFNRAHSVITAPDDGILLKKLAESNEMVAPGYPVLIYGITGQQWIIKTGLSERDLVKVNKGDSVSASFDAWPGIRFPGRVELTGEIANPLTGTFETEILLDRTSSRLAAGFIATIEIYPSFAGIFKLVPVESVIRIDGDTGYLYYVSSDSEARIIKAGIFSITGSLVAVTGVPGDIKTVITEGAAYVRDGMKVKVVE